MEAPIVKSVENGKPLVVLEIFKSFKEKIQRNLTSYQKKAILQIAYMPFSRKMAVM